MQIYKYERGKSNKYKVFTSEGEFTLYDDTIIKYNLLLKKDIDDLLFQEVIAYNAAQDAYYLALRYITKKLRAEKEIREILKRRDFPTDVIDATIKRLRDAHYLDDTLFLNAYINDQINLTLNGPLKIARNLKDYALPRSLIDAKLDSVDPTLWQEKIAKYIAKKVKSNHTNSAQTLKMKLLLDLTNLGYDKEMINEQLSHLEINDSANLKSEYAKAYRILSKKYQGYELEKHIRERLYRKGFRYADLKECQNEE